MNRIEHEKREEWIEMMSAPLEGATKAAPTDAQIEAEGAAFMSLMAQTGSR